MVLSLCLCMHSLLIPWPLTFRIWGCFRCAGSTRENTYYKLLNALNTHAHARIYNMIDYLCASNSWWDLGMQMAVVRKSIEESQTQSQLGRRKHGHACIYRCMCHAFSYQFGCPSSLVRSSGTSGYRSVFCVLNSQQRRRCSAEKKSRKGQSQQAAQRIGWFQKRCILSSGREENSRTPVLSLRFAVWPDVQWRFARN